MSAGYFTFPTVHNDTVVFVSEDDLWSVPLSGGLARRLTTGLGAISHPVFSPDGRFLAFSTEEEGHCEVAVVEAQGGESQRVTYFGAQSVVVGWTPDGKIIFRSEVQSAHRSNELYVVGSEGHFPEPLNLGPAVFINFHSEGFVALERNSHRPDPAHWKRYRGGTRGVIWVGNSLDDEFKYLIELDGNLSTPLWIKDRVYFVSDHEGIGNLYSCKKDGTDLTRHTHQKDFYVRNPRTDGKTVVYHSGGDIFAFDVATNQTKPIEIQYKSQRSQRRRKYVPAQRYLETFNLSPKGQHLTICSRGQVFSFGNWEGPVRRHGMAEATRYRLPAWLNSEKLVMVSDQHGEERIELYDAKSLEPSKVICHPGIGRVVTLKPSPTSNCIALGNHRNQLVLINLDDDFVKVIDRSEHGPYVDLSWSPDGQWLVYTKSVAPNRTGLNLYRLSDGSIHPLTKPFFVDSSPAFDPQGKYVYFLSQRVLDPVYDSLQFELSFPTSVIPCAVALQADTRSPFALLPKQEDLEDKKAESEKEAKKDPSQAAKVSPVKVDLEGITERVVSFPVPAALYKKLETVGGKVAWLKAPMKGALNVNWSPAIPPAENVLELFDFETQKAEPFVNAVSDYTVSANGEYIGLQVGASLRVVKASEKVDEKAAKEQYDRKTGWIDIGRIKLLIEPAQEWRQMLREVWRLQRDHFWVEDMSKVDWKRVLNLYLPLVDKVNCRREFSDLVWELQGELGTSHAYDIGGDYRESPQYRIGKLGVDFVFDSTGGAYRITRCLKTDSWNPQEASPLHQPGVPVKPGDAIVAINGITLNETMTPGKALMNLAGQDVEVSVLHEGEKVPKSYIVKTLTNEALARYRDWVEANREYVHQKTGGRVGYIHIPNMMARGFSEFHRSFLQEYSRDGLIVDVRYNSGGHVSQLLLEKLARKRLGVCVTRWFGVYEFPSESPAGPLVALTNEYAGSDGDIFSHTFKMLGLGPLIGKRTWGGVVGMWPRHQLADGSFTTQPEFSPWFEDVGWRVENYGTDPTIEVEYAPQDYRRGNDPQLDKGIAEILGLLEEKPPYKPEIKEFPVLRPPDVSRSGGGKFIRAFGLF